jgi:hypothetical protein
VDVDGHYIAAARMQIAAELLDGELMQYSTAPMQDQKSSTEDRTMVTEPPPLRQAERDGSR